jgi:hypothetical protein
MSRDDKFITSLQDQYKNLSSRISRFETWEPNQIVYSSANVTNPPTAAELIAAFGAASTFKNKLGILNDNGAGVNVYYVFSSGSAYFYLLFTLAV